MSAILSARRGSWAKRRKQGTGGAEPIEMQERQHGYFPKVFMWRGQRYDVRAVERCWTISRRVWGNRVERHCFRVRCREGAFELYQDTRHNTWHINSI